jgi:hypothetical protein
MVRSSASAPVVATFSACVSMDIPLLRAESA